MDQTIKKPKINPDSVLLRKIQIKTVKIERIVAKNFGGQVADEKKKAAGKKNLAFVLAEERLEKKKPRFKTMRMGRRFRTGLGIMDNIINFFVFTLFGKIFDMTQGFLPKLLGMINLLKGASNIIGWFSNFVINSLVFFIDSGYKVYDNIVGKSKEIKQQPLNQVVDGFNIALNNTLSATTDIINILTGQVANNDNVTTSRPKEQPTKGAAVGGSIGTTRGNIPVNKPITRELRTTKQPSKPRKEPIQKPRIGKDVGGEANVRAFYGSPKVGIGGILGLFRPKNAPIRKTPVDSISTISTTLRGRGGLFGDIASVGSDVALGQKPEKAVYRNTAKDVVYLAQIIANRQENKTKDSILGMAYGGTVPSSVRTISSQADMIDLVEVIIKKSVEERVNNALNELKAPIARRSEEVKKDGINGFFDNVRESFFGSEESGSPGGSYGGYSPSSGIEKEIYNYLINEKKLNDVQALGLMANINRESSFVPHIREQGGTGVGLFQWSHSRVQPFLRAVPDWQKNWKAQIDYALNEPQHLSGVKPGKYRSMNFKSPQEAADWWMSKWERPADETSGSKKHSQYLSNVPKDKNGKVKFREPEKQGFMKGLEDLGSKLDWRKLGFRLGEKAGSMARGYAHAGRDIAIAGGTPLRALSDSVIVASGWDNGYGNYVIFRESNGREHLYGHLESPSPFKPGDKVKQNTVIGKVGSTGRSTGDHLHWETSNTPGKVGYKRSDIVDPIEDLGYSPKMPFSGVKIESPEKAKKEEKKKLEKIKTSVSNKPEVKSKPKQKVANNTKKITKAPKQWYDPRGWFGKRGGGIIGQNPYIPTGYASYENYGGLSVLAIQPMIIHQAVPIPESNPIPIPFPMASGVNNTSNYRA